MELLQLTYFCELARSEALAKTAEKFFISPSSLSHTIKRLENELGLSLFDRVGRNIRLNENGREFYAHIKKALDTIENGVRSTQAKNMNRLTISVGMNTPTLWDQRLAAFRAQYPDIILNLFIVYDEIMLNSIMDRLDFYLGDKFDLPHSEFEYSELFPEEAPILLMNKNNPNACRSTIDLRDLAGETFFSQRQVNFSYDRWERSMFRLAGMDHIKTIEGNLISRIKNIYAGNCIALSTRLGLESNFIDSSDIVAIPLSYPIVFRQQCIFRKKDMRDSASAEQFYNFMLHSSKDS